MRRVQHQTNTNLFRAPELLRSVRARVVQTRTSRQLRALSFGCSLGDEIVSLKAFFPNARIFGCDASPEVLEIARRSVGELADVFPADAREIRSRGPFDLILASAVLCVHPLRDFSQRFPIGLFDEITGVLDEALAPGGLLVINQASYRFQDAPLSDAYDVVRSDLIDFPAHVNVFARDGTPFLIPLQAGGSRLLRRGLAFAVSDDEELGDCIFEKRARGGKRQIHRLRIAPPPESPVIEFAYERSNLDGVLEPVDAGVIEVRRRRSFGCARTPAGETRRGHVLEASWPSFTGPGWFRKEPVWIEQPGES